MLNTNSNKDSEGQTTLFRDLGLQYSRALCHLATVSFLLSLMVCRPCSVPPSSSPSKLLFPLVPTPRSGQSAASHCPLPPSVAESVSPTMFLSWLLSLLEHNCVCSSISSTRYSASWGRSPAWPTCESAAPSTGASIGRCPLKGCGENEREEGRGRTQPLCSTYYEPDPGLTTCIPYPARLGDEDGKAQRGPAIA